jgi:hypothetical protein
MIKDLQSAFRSFADNERTNFSSIRLCDILELSLVTKELHYVYVQSNYQVSVFL